MDDERGASIAEQGMAVAAERDVRVLPLEMRFAFGVDGKVWTVASVMALRILQSMLLTVRIEMRPRGLEVRGVALRVLVKVDGMFTRRQILDIDVHPDPRAGFPEDRGAHTLALGILELNHSLGWASRGERDHEQSDWEQTSGFHGRDYSEMGFDARAAAPTRSPVPIRSVGVLPAIAEALLESGVARQWAHHPLALAQNAGQWDNRQMQRSLTTALLLAAAMMLAGDGYAQQTPASNPAATTPAAPQATTPKAATTKAPVKKPATAAALTTREQKFSYALGMSIGTQVGGNLKKQSVAVDPALVSQGMKDALSGAKPLLTQEEAQAVLTEVQNEVRKEQQEKMKEAADKNKTEGEAFLAANKSKEGVVTLPDGLQYKILTAGTGPKPAATDSVVCNYRGTLINGTEFDSSYKRGQPATFGVSQVIKGWTEALQLMPTGSKWQLFIPSSLAYGERGAGADIGPDATLIFEVELVSIVDKNAEKNKDEKKDDKTVKPEDKK